MKLEFFNNLIGYCAKKNKNVIYRLGRYVLEKYLPSVSYFPVRTSQPVNNPRANDAKRRSGRKPGARATNSALALTYIRIMRSYIAQWHSGIKSRPPFWIWTLVGHLTLCACVNPDREKAGN